MQLYLAAVLQILSMCPFCFMWCLILQDGLEHPCKMTAGFWDRFRKTSPQWTTAYQDSAWIMSWFIGGHWGNSLPWWYCNLVACTSCYICYIRNNDLLKKLVEKKREKKEKKKKLVNILIIHFLALVSGSVKQTLDIQGELHNKFF